MTTDNETMKTIVDYFAFWNRRELERVMDRVDKNIVQEFRAPKPAELVGDEAFRTSLLRSFASSTGRRSRWRSSASSSVAARRAPHRPTKLTCFSSLTGGFAR